MWQGAPGATRPCHATVTEQRARPAADLPTGGATQTDPRSATLRTKRLDRSIMASRSGAPDPARQTEATSYPAPGAGAGAGATGPCGEKSSVVTSSSPHALCEARLEPGVWREPVRIDQFLANPPLRVGETDTAVWRVRRAVRGPVTRPSQKGPQGPPAPETAPRPAAQPHARRPSPRNRAAPGTTPPKRSPPPAPETATPPNRPIPLHGARDLPPRSSATGAYR